MSKFIRPAALVLAGAFLLAGALLCLQLTPTGPKSYLRVAGVEGESTDADHGGEIEILYVTWGRGVRAPTATGGPGSVTITKQVDKTSPLLMSKARARTTIAEATLKTPGKGPDGRPGILTYKMSGVTIASNAPSPGAKSGQESITLNYKQISVTFAAQKR